MHSLNLSLLWRRGPKEVRTSSILRFSDNTQRHTNFGRTPQDELPSRRRDLFLRTDNTHNTQTLPQRDSKPQSQRRAAADPHLISRSHWDRNSLNLRDWFFFYYYFFLKGLYCIRSLKQVVHVMVSSKTVPVTSLFVVGEELVGCRG